VNSQNTGVPIYAVSTGAMADLVNVSHEPVKWRSRSPGPNGGACR